MRVSRGLVGPTKLTVSLHLSGLRTMGTLRVSSTLRSWLAGDSVVAVVSTKRGTILAVGEGVIGHVVAPAVVHGGLGLLGGDIGDREQVASVVLAGTGAVDPYLNERPLAVVGRDAALPPSPGLGVGGEEQRGAPHQQNGGNGGGGFRVDVHGRTPTLEIVQAGTVGLVVSNGRHRQLHPLTPDVGRARSRQARNQGGKSQLSCGGGGVALAATMRERRRPL